jgi:uncharacterized peroxidase-related enzyme
MSGRAPETSFFLPGVEASPKPGTYERLIATARERGAPYSKIWDLLAFQSEITAHLSRFTHGVLREPASITPGFRELIAAYTSSLNACGFCTRAHAATAAELLGSERLVEAVLRDADTAPLVERERLMLRFVRTITLELPQVSEADVASVRDAGWDDEAIYYAITTCALFNFYNRWVSATGVPEMDDRAHREQGRHLAAHGYIRREDADGSH